MFRLLSSGNAKVPTSSTMLMTVYTPAYDHEAVLAANGHQKCAAIPHTGEHAGSSVIFETSQTAWLLPARSPPTPAVTTTSKAVAAKVHIDVPMVVITRHANMCKLINYVFITAVLSNIRFPLHCHDTIVQFN